MMKTLKLILQAIEWVKLTDLPTWRKQKQKVTGKKFYSVAPFVAWVSICTYQGHTGPQDDPQRLIDRAPIIVP